MLADWVAILAAFALFSTVGLLPGYALGWSLNLVRFRTRAWVFRLVLSVPMSIALGPVISYLIGRWLSMGAVLAVYGIGGLYALFLMVRAPRAPLRLPRIAVILVLIWITLAMLMLADLQIHRRVYFPIIAFDYAVRTAFTAAIDTWGIPAPNPFFFPGHFVGLRYHYFWLIQCALIERIGSPLVSARTALIAGTMWCGIGLMCLVALYLRLFSPQAQTDISRRATIGIALLAVTGLDIVPALWMLWLNHRGVVAGVSPSVEWWNNQVDGWLYTMLWEPHYLCSVIACLMGFLILWDAAEDGGRRWIAPGIAAGLAFATAAGSGIYVAMIFAIFLTLWFLITTGRKWYRETRLLALAGIVAMVTSLPFLKNLRGPGSGGPLLQLTIRSFDPVEFLHLNRPWMVVLANAMLLPANYFLELGFFFAVGLTVWKNFRAERRSSTRQELAAFTLAGASIVVCTFVKSTVTYTNDLGWRGFLLAQFILLMWAADLVADLLSGRRSLARADRTVLAALLAVGCAGVGYDLAILRFYPVLSDAGKVPRMFWLASDEKLGERTYANRQAYDWLKASSSVYTIVQQNPNPPFQDTFYGLYADRRTVAEDADCRTNVGGDPGECAAVVNTLMKLFPTDGESTPGSFQEVCRSLPLDVVAAKDTDAVWRERSSWVWNVKPIFANDFVRLFSCHE